MYCDILPHTSELYSDKSDSNREKRKTNQPQQRVNISFLHDVDEALKQWM